MTNANKKMTLCKILSFPIRFYDLDFAKTKTILSRITILKTLVQTNSILSFLGGLRLHGDYLDELITRSKTTGELT